jgi:hypothetical protein
MPVTTFKNVSHRWSADSRARLAAASATIPVVLLVSLLGPGWLFVPANQAAKMPETTLSFGNLHDLANSGAVPTTNIQQWYFGWLGWTLVLATGITALLIAVLARRALMVLLGVLSVAGVVVTTFGLKGALSWADFFDQVPNVRLGGYLVFIGYLSALAFGALLASRERLQRN